ncbi:MAG TPA: response regulator [bacterium]|nr:response regulator [bacterium]
MKEVLKILLVDDDQDILEVIGMLLKMDGAEVHIAENYNEALSLLEEVDIDITVTDWRMPGMHGLYLLDMIKDKHPEMPVIIMTAYLSDKVMVEARRKKVNMMIEKPFEYSELLAGIQKLMRIKWQNQNGTRKQSSSVS